MPLLAHGLLDRNAAPRGFGEIARAQTMGGKLLRIEVSLEAARRGTGKELGLRRFSDWNDLVV